MRATIVILLGKYSTVKEQAITKLYPIVEISDTKYAILTQQVAGIERTSLGAGATNISGYMPEFIDTIELGISGI